MNMHSSRFSRFAPVIASALIVAAGFAIAGPLNPPAGPVTSTMKTMTEVEPRIAINATNTPAGATSVFKISQPGTYYLTGNVSVPAGKNGIEIGANNVTIDMNGATIIGVTGSLDGIMLTTGTIQRMTIRNGKIQGMGSDGVAMQINSGNLEHATLEGLTIDSCLGNGAFISDGIVRDCQFSSNGQYGLRSESAESETIVQGCKASRNGNTGFYISRGIVDTSTAAFNTTVGIFMAQGIVRNCTVLNSQAGLRISGGAAVDNVIENCGITAFGDTTLIGNTITADSVVTGSMGIFCNQTASLRIEGNTITRMATGISVLVSGNFIAGNRLKANTSALSVVAGNRVGTLVTGTSSAAINGNTGGGLGITDPYANIIY